MKAAATLILALFVLMAALMGSGVCEAGLFENPGSEGNRLNREGKYDEAIKKYEEALKKTPDSDALNYNMGTAYYRKGDYQKAIEHFTKSMSSKNSGIEMRSNYNAGNSHYMIGKAAEEGINPSEAIQSFEEALQYFKRAVELDDTDKDARRNFELTNRKIQELKEKQKTQPQKDKKDDKKDKKDDKDKDKNKDNKDKDKDKDKGKDDKDKDKDKGKDKGKDDKDNGKDDKDKDAQKPKESAAPTPVPENKQGNKGKEARPQAMSKDEAEMLLEGLKQDNVPRGMLDDKAKRSGTPNVLKDW
ncbi:MAG: tetratricopeptide repeat protein [Nitrospirae bacterium]|nr:tetratricopeptide repeat protein [Nitrospirota bacterium]